MAGDWIKMRTDLVTHPKVVRILSALKADKFRVVGALHAVWCLFDTHSTDGRLEGYTPEVLDDHLGWPGFSAEMIRVNWLEHDGESLATPRFQEHNGQSAKRRATDAERKRMARESGEMSAPDADKKRTREEKRREEDKPPTVVKRASRKCPADFEVTEDMRTWAALECPTVNVAKATAKFCDHTFKTAMTDWNGAWRNWLRRDAESSMPATGKQSEPGWRRDARERMQAAVPSIAEKSSASVHDFFEAEVKNVTPLTLG